jgi:hypothetical protein
MASDNHLRQALDSADLQPGDLSGLIGVDTRTVRRWLSGQAPYPRHRAKIARALGLTEEALWPELPPTTQPLVRDVITGYPSAESIGVPAPETLIQGDRDRIELLDQTLLRYLRPEGLTELLIQQAVRGTQVRIMVAEPGYHLAPLLEQPRIELRVVDFGEHQTIHRYDDQMLVTLPLAGKLDEPPALIHVQRRAEGGLFDRLAAHYDDSWEHATEPLCTEADIERHVYEDEPDDETVELDDPATQVAAAQPAESSASPPRRWPRRPPDD